MVIAGQIISFPEDVAVLRINTRGAGGAVMDEDFAIFCGGSGTGVAVVGEAEGGLWHLENGDVVDLLAGCEVETKE